MIIPPRHIALTEMERLLTENNYFNDWKIELSRLVNNFKQNLPEGIKLQLWDFALINDYTSEKVSEPGENMKWFRDRIHFKDNLGNHVLDIVFDNDNGGNISPSNFGVAMDYLNIVDHLDNSERISQEFRSTNKMYLENLGSNVQSALNSYIRY